VRGGRFNEDGEATGLDTGRERSDRAVRVPSTGSGGFARPARPRRQIIAYRL